MIGNSHARDAKATGSTEFGLTLTELAVVIAVMLVLAGMVAIAVTGSATRARGATKATDIREVQKAVNAYRAMHPQEKWPTAGKQIGDQRIDAGRLPRSPFVAISPATYVAIDWSATFTTTLDGARSMVPSFLPTMPKHAMATTMDADGDGVPEQPNATPVWVLDRAGVVNVLLSDDGY